VAARGFADLLTGLEVDGVGELAGAGVPEGVTVGGGDLAAVGEGRSTIVCLPPCTITASTLRAAVVAVAGSVATTFIPGLTLLIGI
jgi:hypothetical protein